MGNVREKLIQAKDEIQSALNLLRDPGFIPKPALELLEKAKNCSKGRSDFKNIVMEVVAPILGGRSNCHDRQFTVDLITLTAMGARLQRYILGHGGPVSRDIHTATIAAVSIELTKENKCRDGYPRDNTVDSAFGSFALALYQLFDTVRQNRRCYRG